MAKPRLTCLFFSDLSAWERMAVEPMLEQLSANYEVHAVDVTETHRDYFKKSRPHSAYWILSRNWRQAVRFLKVRSDRRTSVYASIFNFCPARTPLFHLFLSKFASGLPSSLHLLVHSPLNFRFYREIEGVRETQVTYLPLPLPWKPEVSPKSPRDTFCVGAFGPFSSESNLNFLMGVAHYLVKENPSIRFRLLGSGELYGHLSQTIQELGLGDSVTVVETSRASDIRELDLMLYAPIRNDHYIPLLLAASEQIPVLACELPGIEDLIQDGHTGFLTPLNEAKPMAELVLRLMKDSHARSEIGRKLHQCLEEKFSATSLAKEYEAVLFHEKEVKRGVEHAA